VLGSILGALKAIVNVVGMEKMTPPIKGTCVCLCLAFHVRFILSTCLKRESFDHGGFPDLAHRCGMYFS